MSDFLTDEERDLVGQLGACWNAFAKIVGDGSSRAADCAEFVTAIHICQNAVLSQAAARAYPTEFRLLGESFGDPS